MKYFKSFNSFLSEAEAYDEPTSPPNASFRQEDWAAKDKLRYISDFSDELTKFIEDGEELEESQLKLIQSTFDNINLLKRQIEGREKVKAEKEEELYKDLNNPNL